MRTRLVTDTNARSRLRAWGDHPGAVWTVLAGLALVVGGCGSDVFMPVTGTIYGTVLTPSGAPAESVRIVVEGTGLSTRSDRSGRFVVNGVASVQEGRIGATCNVRGEKSEAGTALGFVKMQFRVKEQQSYSIGTVKLQPCGAIRGSVGLGDSADPGGVRVRLDGLSLEAHTNGRGEFVLSSVPPYSHYRLVCEREGYASHVVMDVVVSAGAPTTLPPAAMPRLP